MAARTENPWAAIRPFTNSSIIASPPNRWVAPVTSSSKPSVPSQATNGLKRSHQSAMFSNSAASDFSSAGSTVSSRTIAWALARG